MLGMRKHILIIDGHPDAPPHLLHDLADAYAAGAMTAGYEVQRIDLSAFDVPVLHSPATWRQPATGKIAEVQNQILWADHLAIFYPLWLGDMPAVVKAFFEDVMRPGFAFDEGRKPGKAGRLGGRSAHVIVTMGMPAFWYRSFYRAHSVKSFERNILNFVGIGPVQHFFVGGVTDKKRDYKGWFKEMTCLGEAGGCVA
jgi:putative NADPH-quinone reductase